MGLAGRLPTGRPSGVTRTSSAVRGFNSAVRDAIAGSEIRRVRRGNRRVRAQIARVLGADRLRPVADEAPISDPPRPGRRENGWVVHRKLDLQPLLGGVGVDDAASVRRIDPVRYGTVLSLDFGGGFAVDQTVALDDMQRLAVGSSAGVTGASLLLAQSTIYWPTAGRPPL